MSRRSLTTIKRAGAGLSVAYMGEEIGTGPL